MKKKLKILSWVVSIIVLTVFSSLLGVLSKSEHGRVYTYTESNVSYDITTDSYIMRSDKMSLEFINEQIIKLTHNITGMEPESVMGVYYINDGRLYSNIDMSDYDDFEYLGEIDAYEFDVFESGGMPAVFKCEKNIKLKTIYTVGIVAGVLLILANVGFEIYEVLKKKGIIKLKVKPVEESKKSSEIATKETDKSEELKVKTDSEERVEDKSDNEKVDS